LVKKVDLLDINKDVPPDGGEARGRGDFVGRTKRRGGGRFPSGEKTQGPFCENAAAQAQLISETIKK
jgi:hypothetical protein